MSPLIPLVLAALLGSPPSNDGFSHKYCRQVSTRHFDVGTENERVVYARRPSTGRAAVEGTEGLWPEDAVEAPDETLWIVASASAAHRHDVHQSGELGAPAVYALRVFRPGASALASTVGQAPVLDGGTPKLGLSASGDLGIAWVVQGHEAGELRLLLAWVDRKGHVADAREIDRVVLPSDVAALSRLTGFDLAIVPHGEGLAVLWRPLRAPDRPRQTGDEYNPPEGDFPAEIRVVLATRKGARVASRYDTVAGNLGFYTGIGPWPLRTAQAQTAKVGDERVFVWIAPGTVPFRPALLGAHPGDARPTVLACDCSDRLVNTLGLPPLAEGDALLRALLPGAAQVECPPPIGR